MTDLTLHFDADPGIDRAALITALQARCAAFAEVESARVEVDRPRSLAAGLPDVADVLLFLQVSGELLGAGTVSLVALKHFIQAVKDVAAELGLRNVKVEAGARRVAPEELKEQHVKRMHKR